MRKTFRSENLKGRDNLEDLHEDGRIVLALILGKYGVRYGLDLSGSG
jgi:hypothetical protein